MISARNSLGSSPKSKSLIIRTLESGETKFEEVKNLIFVSSFYVVPLVIVNDLTATLLNASTVFISWTIDKTDFHLLNGRFRTFSLSIYENYSKRTISKCFVFVFLTKFSCFKDMSTLLTIETNRTEMNISNLHSSSKYFLSVAVCNFFSCGTSSSSLVVETPSISKNINSTSDSSVIISHPVNKPFQFDCPSSLDKTRFYSNHEYRCGSKWIHLRFYGKTIESHEEFPELVSSRLDKPSTIEAHLHYTTSNEIGLKFVYPPEIIESLTINYKIFDRISMNELIVSPPVLNLRLKNLSCGTHYKIMAYASNEAGFSSTTSLNVRTEGSGETKRRILLGNFEVFFLLVPTFDEHDELIEMITNESIVLNLKKIRLHRCSIVSFEITVSFCSSLWFFVSFVGFRLDLDVDEFDDRTSRSIFEFKWSNFQRRNRSIRIESIISNSFESSKWRRWKRENSSISNNNNLRSFHQQRRINFSSDNFN